MDISPKLADLNFERYQNLAKNEINKNNSIAALLTFDGDVYQEIDVENFDNSDYKFAQQNLFILSGLYGVLKALDLMLPYRLEMGTNFKNSKIAELVKCNNLYEFWGEKITNYFNNLKGEYLVNLASQEYFDAIKTNKLNKKIINIIFKEEKNGKLKIVGTLAKRARGMMTNFIIKNKIQNPQDLKKFNQKNYKFRQDLSNEHDFIFVKNA